MLLRHNLDSDVTIINQDLNQWLEHGVNCRINRPCQHKDLSSGNQLPFLPDQHPQALLFDLPHHLDLRGLSGFASHVKQIFKEQETAQNS